MNTFPLRPLAALTLALTLLLSGCGGGNQPAAPDQSAQSAAQSADTAIRVSSVEELMENLKSGADIVLTEGTYNLTQWAAEKTESPDYQRWQGLHPQIQFEFDQEGPAVLFYDLEGLTLRGEGKVHIQTEPRYYDVLSFLYCTGITLEHLTLGHNAEPGYCSGGVVRLQCTTDATLRDLDLYGCGTYGVTTTEAVHVRVEDCVIRDCSYGMVDSLRSSDVYYKNCLMKNCADMWMICPGDSALTFENCTFTESVCNDPFLMPSSGIVRFLGCTFGPEETEALQAVSACGSYAFDEGCTFSGDAPRMNRTVGTVDELISAMGSNVTLWLKPGTYNLTPWLDKTWAAHGERWNAEHPCVRIEEVYDGYQLSLWDLSGLGLFGLTGDPDDVEIVVEPRYADVLAMYRCFDMALFGLTMGHTEKEGYCSGDVVDLYDCSDIALGSMDLYGCGVYGICAQETQNLLVFDSRIHDCSDGPASIQECYNTVQFCNVEFVDSDGGFALWNSDEYLTISFHNCVFGTCETNSLYFRDDVDTLNCQWSEVTEYPDYSDYDDDPTVELELMELNTPLLTRSVWYGLMGNREGRTYFLDEEDLYWTLLFWDDGTGQLEGYYEAPAEFSWQRLDGDLYAKLTFKDDYGDAYVCVYGEEDEPQPLLELSITDDIIWMTEAAG